MSRIRVHVRLDTLRAADYVQFACGARRREDSRWIMARLDGGLRNPSDARVVTCKACKAWINMSPQQRFELELEQRKKAREKKDKSAAAFAVLQERKRLSDGWGRLGRLIAIEASRADALVAMDMLEEKRELRSELVAFVSRVCAIAVMAHRIENPASRGERLWVYRPLEIVRDRAERMLRNQVCRFCDAVVRERVTIGSDHTLAGGHPIVSAHTSACAARYLAGALAPQPSSDPAVGDETRQP